LGRQRGNRVKRLVVDKPIAGNFFHNTNLTIEAVPEPGYRFTGWQGISTNTPVLSILLSSDTTLTALFEPNNASIIPPVIDRDTVLAANLSPWYAIENVTVHAGAKLTIEAGCELFMTDKVSVYVHGGLNIGGTPERPVSIMPDPSAKARWPHYNRQPRWGVIAAIDAADSVVIKHAQISGSGFGNDRNKLFATITSLNSNTSIEHTSITDNIQSFYSEQGSVYIGHSAFRMTNTGDLINIKYTDKALVEYCDLMGNTAIDTDAIDYDGVTGGIIRHNRIYGFWGSNSDGIDLGEGARDVLIEGNIIYGISDKGISIGQGSTATIRRNLIFGSDMGIAVKDSFSSVLIDQNTFYANNYSIACYEKNSGRGGGYAAVKNSILAGSVIAPLLSDQLSSIDVSYSMSDSKALPGTGNLLADPLFVNPFAGNFELQPNSPCINAGDPFSERDPDNTRADMGAYYTHLTGSDQNVFINEINYHPAENFNTGSWIELYNASSNTVSIEGWQIINGSKRYVFKSAKELMTGEYLVICENIELFTHLHPDVNNAMGNLGFALNNDAGNLYLMDAANNMIHSLMYNNKQPLASLTSGKGASLELEQSAGRISWFARGSYVLGGTPGEPNSSPPNYNGLYINELMASNKNTIADEHGDFDDWFEIYNNNDYPVNIGGIYFSDNLTNPAKWQVPLNHPELTTIGPKSFLLIWADNEPHQGPMHSTFKLSADGEELGMFQQIDNHFHVIDQLVFGQTNNTQSYGRYPDGGNNLDIMHPTPGGSNWKTGVKSPQRSMLTVYPNPFDQLVTFNIESLSKPVNINIYNLHGNIVWQSNNNTENHVIIMRDKLQKGVYLYRAIASDGQQYSGKIGVY
jgi:parallel beta-helix repeat protein